MIMTRKEARALLKEHGATKLRPTTLAVLTQLVNSIYLGKDNANADIEGKQIVVSERTLAAKCGLQTERGLRKQLRKLEKEFKLITITHDGNRNRYSVHLAPMQEWETVATVRARRRRESLEARRVTDKVRRAIKQMQEQKASAHEDDPHAELIAYANIERGGNDEQNR
jgi:hypothetical protein